MQTRTQDPAALRVATVRRALPDVEVKIADIETGETLPPGRQGELCSRGYLVMKGYYKMSEETDKVIAEEIIDFCRGSIANYKAPRYVKFVDEFPMIASGKKQKFKLREMAINELNLETVASVETV